MPRGKIQMGLIGKASARARTFKTRKDGLMNKASELAILCDVEIALVVGGEPDPWEFGGAGVVDRYRRLPADKRAKHTLLGYLDANLGKEKESLAKKRREGPRALALESPGKALKGMDLDELLASIDAALLATARRRKELGVPDDDDATVVDAVPLGQGVPFTGEGDDDMEAWIDELTWHDDELHPLNASTMTMQPAPGAQYIDGVEPSPLNAGMTQPAYGVQYINGLQQQMGGNGESNHAQMSWNACQLHNTVSYPGYGFEYTDSSYSDMDDGCPQMLASSNANAYGGCWFNQAMSGTGESPQDAVVPVDCYHHPSLADITGNHVYTPPEHSGMATGDCFTDVSDIGLDGSFMGESSHGYGNQCLADYYFQCPDASQQFGEEPLHYLSDVAEGFSYYDFEAGSCGPGRTELSVQSQQLQGILQF